jgi:hypothetical protein
MPISIPSSTKNDLNADATNIALSTTPTPANINGLQRQAPSQSTPSTPSGTFLDLELGDSDSDEEEEELVRFCFICFRGF